MRHLALASDAAYLPHAAAAIRSALQADPPQETHIHLLHEGRLRDLPRLQAMVQAAGAQFTGHTVDAERLSGLPRWGRIPRTMWLRIYLPELLPTVPRVLYLDCDTLVLDTLAPLFELALDDHLLAAVTNVLPRAFATRPAELGLSTPYFNSGVLLLNLERMRAEGVTEQLRAYAAEHAPTLLWPDQDALNVVLGPRRLAISPRWNAMNSLTVYPWSAEVLGAEAVREARERPAILHFEGPAENKPWHLLSRHRAAAVYWEHRAATPWPRRARTGRTPWNLLRAARRRMHNISG